MCDPTPDPRDAAGAAERALFGLRRLLNELPPSHDLSAECIAPLVELIHDRLEPAVDALQKWRSPDWGQPAV